MPQSCRSQSAGKGRQRRHEKQVTENEQAKRSAHTGRRPQDTCDPCLPLIDERYT
jgi:hypothetical protein